MKSEDSNSVCKLLFQVSLISRSLTCLECLSATAALDLWISSGATVEEVEDLAINECIVLNLFPEDVCFGMVKLAGVCMKTFDVTFPFLSSLVEDTDIVGQS